MSEFNPQFPLEVSATVYDQVDSLRADNYALRRLARTVGAELPERVLVRVATSPTDNVFPPVQFPGEWVGEQQELSPAEERARNLRIDVPEVTTEALTSELARLFYHDTVLNPGAAARERRMRVRGFSIAIATLACMGLEALRVEYVVGIGEQPASLREALLLCGTFAAGAIGAVLNRRWYASSRRQYPLVLLGENLQPIKVKTRHSAV